MFYIKTRELSNSLTLEEFSKDRLYPSGLGPVAKLERFRRRHKLDKEGDQVLASFQIIFQKFPFYSTQFKALEDIYRPLVPNSPFPFNVSSTFIGETL